jgi:hypothetical protein
MQKALLLTMILLVTFSAAFQLQTEAPAVTADLTVTNITIPKGFTNLNISASVIGSFNLNSTSDQGFLSVYISAPGQCYSSYSYSTQ